MRRARDERGAVLAMAAVMIPVFLLLTALVVDVGNWFTHDRQLQNRADAAAFAAGVEYAENWKACVQTADNALKLATAQEIADAARQYAADPEASDYTGGTLPATLYNTEIANQANVDVVVNSSDPNYNDDSDHSDLGGDTRSPCLPHTTGDDVSAPGYWTDVRVKERNIPSLFRTLGLGIARAGGRARVDIRPAVSGHRFLPLAVPDNQIERVQVRYYNECTGAQLASYDLKQLPDGDQAAWRATGGGALWALPSVADPNVGDANRAFTLTLPAYTTSCSATGGEYVPVGVEVRLASQPGVNFSQTCAQLLALRYADCFRRISQIRIWNTGNPDSQPRVRDVILTGGCPYADAYFGALPIGATDCKYGANVDVEWGTRDDGNKAIAANFSVRVNGVAASPPGASQPSGVWTVPSTALSALPDANTVTVELDWADTDTSHNWNGQCKPGNKNPCVWSGNAEPEHRAFGGTPATAGAVELVRSSQSTFVSGLPGPAFANQGGGNVPVQIYPTIGTRAVLKAGILTVLRTEDPQGSQLLRCDPAVSQGQEFTNFINGCEPWYGVNTFDDAKWWNAGTQECPDQSLWFGTGTMPAPYGANSSTNWWECVPLAPGSSNGQTGNWMSVSTGNCDDIANNSCQNVVCNVEGNYDGKTGKPMGWLQQGGNSADPRVVSLFVIPYQSLKGVSGSNEEAPVTGFASFYVMDWAGSNAQKSDQCPDPDFNGVTLPPLPKGTVRGVFVEAVDYEPGPVDPNATCTEEQLIPCRVTLVR